MDLDELLRLIDEERYFVLRAPRQTGKTTVLRALMQRLNAGGGHRCVYVNVEVAQAAREDVGAGMQAILYKFSRESAWTIGDQTVNGIWAGILERAGPYSALEAVLSEWATADPKPLAVFCDEIDALVGSTLISVLRQLRSGYGDRPRRLPQSAVLCGVRNVRDYRVRTSTGEVVLGGSAFNIKAKSMRLGDFSEDEVHALLGQHTGGDGTGLH